MADTSHVIYTFSNWVISNVNQFLEVSETGMLAGEVTELKLNLGKMYYITSRMLPHEQFLKSLQFLVFLEKVTT